MTMRAGSLIIVASAALTLAGCSSGHPHPVSTSAAPIAAASSKTASCTSQFDTWRAGGGITDIKAVSKALTRAAHAGRAELADSFSSASVARLGEAAASLQAAAQTAQNDPAPACVPGVRAAEGTGLAAYARGAQGEINATQAIQNGDLQTAATDLTAAAGAIKTGNSAFERATSAIDTFNGG
jgi:hypothetical protein